MIKIRHIMLSVLCIGTALLLSGCDAALLNPKGIIAASEKHLIITSALLMLIVVIPVIILTIAFAWKYRSGNTKAKYAPEWDHSTLVEIVCWGIPCILIGILGVMTWKTSHSLDPYKHLADKKEAMVIQVIALDWKWLFIYPEQNIASVNFVQFPVNVPVRFHITAEGAMNSLQIPQLAGQIYAMAGMKTQLNIMADTVGDYRGISANFSGEGFSDMRFVARASTEAEFNQWVQNVKQSPEQLTDQMYAKLVQPSQNNPVEYFSSARPGLFDDTVMKSMMPMENGKMESGQPLTKVIEK